MNGIPFKTSFWINSCISLFLFIFGIIFLLKFIKKTKSVNYFKYLIIVVVILILAQLLQFLLAIFHIEFLLENYSGEFDKYYNGENKKAIYGTYYALFEYLQYLSIGLIVFINIKKSKINSIS